MDIDLIDLLKEIYRQKHGEDYTEILSSDIKYVMKKYDVSQP